MWSVVNKSQRCNSGSRLIIVISPTFLRRYSSVRGRVNGVVWPFSPSPAYWSMHSGPRWLMSGQQEEKPIPRLQCGTSDGWFFGSLRRSEHRRPEGWEEDRRGRKGWGLENIYYRISHLYFYLCVFSLPAQKLHFHYPWNQQYLKCKWKKHIYIGCASFWQLKSSPVQGFLVLAQPQIHTTHEYDRPYWNKCFPFFSWDSWMKQYPLLIVLYSLGTSSRHPGWSVNITLNKTSRWGNTAALVIALCSRCCGMRLIRVLGKTDRK